MRKAVAEPPNLTGRSSLIDSTGGSKASRFAAGDNRFGRVALVVTDQSRGEKRVAPWLSVHVVIVGRMGYGVDPPNVTLLSVLYARPVGQDDPDVETLVDLIAWDTFKHYPEHVAANTGHA